MAISNGGRGRRMCLDLSHLLSFVPPSIPKTMSSSLCASCRSSSFTSQSMYALFFAEMWTRPAPLSHVEESSVRAKIAELQNDIRAREGQLERIAEEKATLEDYVLRASALFAPIRRVPAEILMRIFQMLLPVGVCKFPRAFTPARVCRMWRSKQLLSTSTKFGHIELLEAEACKHRQRMFTSWRE